MSRKRRERREALRAAAGTSAVQRSAAGVAESYAFQGTEFVDRRDWMPVQFGFAGMQGYGINLMSSLNDRRDGRNAPFVENEYDAKTIRGFARFITTVNCPGIGIVETLQNYIIGRGIKVRVSPKKRRQIPDGLVDVAQDLIDEFNEDNKVIGDYDRESLLGDRVDGEGYLGLYPKGGKTALRPIEPDSVADPGGPPFNDEELQEVYGVQLQFPTRWSFGHHTDAHDIMNCHGYCVRWEPSDPFDYLPARFVHHSKVNVRRNVLRGMSDFYPAWKWLKQQERLLSNTGEGAAELAAIAYITQFSTGTQEQVRTMRQGQADYEYRRVGPNGASQTIYKHHREPGVLSVPQGQEYLPGPMGHERGQSFLQVVQGILRQVAVRWGMTEGMVSADDSNNNMASSIEAGSRFWKYADASQGRECSKWQAIYMRVLENAHEMGRFARFELTWEEVKACLVVTVTCPEIDVRDPKILADTRAIEKEHGVLSIQTWADEAGYDHDKEVQQGAVDTSGDAGLSLGKPVGPDGAAADDISKTALNGAQVTSLMEVMEKAAAGQIPRESVGPLIIASFPMLTPQQIEDITGPLVNFKPAADPGDQQNRQAGEYEDKSRLQWKRNVKAIQDILDSVKSEGMTEGHAKIQLGLLGLAPDKVDALLADIADGELTPENQQSLSETYAAHVSPHWRLVMEAGAFRDYP